MLWLGRLAIFGKNINSKNMENEQGENNYPKPLPTEEEQQRQEAFDQRTARQRDLRDRIRHCRSSAFNSRLQNAVLVAEIALGTVGY